MEQVSKIFPGQKLPFSQKTSKWGKECVEGGIQLTLTSDSRIRQTYYNKKKNYDLYNDVIDLKDVESVCSPLGFDMNTFPATMQNYPLCNPKIKLLLGEEQKRRFEWRVVSTNPGVISKKESKLMEDIQGMLESTIKEEMEKGNTNEATIKAKLSSIQNYYKYDYQDSLSKMASSLLNYYYQEQDLKYKFNRGFEDALIAGEEYYRIDIVSGQPKVVKCNPLNIFVYGNGVSNFIDEADLILEVGYYSFGQIIDEFHEELKDTEIKELEDNIKKTFGGGSSGNPKNEIVNYRNFHPTLKADFFSGTPIDIPVFDNIHTTMFHPFDSNGNILVQRLTWKSKRKVGKLTSLDEFGQEQVKFVDERYPVDQSVGEKVTWLWINEYWEGIKIADNIFVRIQPKPVQFRNMNNPSLCKSGYVGAAYNVNDNRARSLYDQMKPYQYLFNIFMYRAELGFARFKFPIFEINTSVIPDGWEPEKWLQYAEVLGYAFVDPTSEIKKGPARGQIAGSLNNTFGGRVMETKSVGDYIQSNISMLQYIERQVGNISGVTEQRQGQIETRESVGNVERSVTQSSHITESWFGLHEYVKLKVLSTLLETAKYCLRNETDLRLNYILDDLSVKTSKVDVSELNSSDFDIFLTTSNKYIEFEQSVKQLAHAAMQNQMIGFKELIQLLHSNSIYDMTKIIETAEEKKQLQVEKEAEANRQHEKEITDANIQAQNEARQYEIDKREDEQMHDILAIRIQAEEDRATKLLEKQLSSDEVNMDEVNLKLKEFELKKQKQEEELALKRNKLKDDKELSYKKLEQDKELKEKQISVQKIKKSSSK
jgi:hypothetical protein